jgi:hypothetical protein
MFFSLPCFALVYGNRGWSKSFIIRATPVNGFLGFFAAIFSVDNDGDVP